MDRLQGILITENGWRGINSEKALAINIPIRTEFELPGGLISASKPSQNTANLSLGMAFIFAFFGRTYFEFDAMCTAGSFIEDNEFC